jgi:hypothetical protein
MSAWALAGVGVTISSAPDIAAARSSVGRMLTGRPPLKSVTVMPPASTTCAKSLALRRHQRTSWPASAKSAAAA